MNSTIKTSNAMTEMLFENRNKEYGAYAIRTTYNDALVKSMLTVASALLLFVGSTYAYNNFFKERSVLAENPVYSEQIKVIPLDLTNPAEPKPIEQPKSHYTPKMQAMATVIRDNADPKPDPDAQTGPLTSPGTQGDTTDVLVVVQGDPKGKDPEPMPVIDADPVTVPDEMPEYPGGTAALMAFLSGNMTYPERAVGMGIEGTVFVNFVVNQEGEVEKIKILKGIGGGCNEEAMRVVSKMPKWKPGIQAGKKVKVYYNLPIRFQLK